MYQTIIDNLYEKEALSDFEYYQLDLMLQILDKLKTIDTDLHGLTTTVELK